MMTHGLIVSHRAVCCCLPGERPTLPLNILIPAFVLGGDSHALPQQSLLMNIKRDIFLRVKPRLFIPFIVF